MEQSTKIVEFYYCRYCKHFKEPEDSETCHECLNNPVNEYSRKPVNYNGKFIPQTDFLAKWEESNKKIFTDEESNKDGENQV